MSTRSRAASPADQSTVGCSSVFDARRVIEVRRAASLERLPGRASSSRRRRGSTRSIDRRTSSTVDVRRRRCRRGVEHQRLARFSDRRGTMQRRRTDDQVDAPMRRRGARPSAARPRRPATPSGDGGARVADEARAVRPALRRRPPASGGGSRRRRSLAPAGGCASRRRWRRRRRRARRRRRRPRPCRSSVVVALALERVAQHVPRRLSRAVSARSASRLRRNARSRRAPSASSTRSRYAAADLVLRRAGLDAEHLVVVVTSAHRHDASRSWRSASSLSIGTRSWLIESRSRTVTARSSRVSKSTVTQNGRADLVLATVAAADRAGRRRRRS